MHGVPDVDRQLDERHAVRCRVRRRRCSRRSRRGRTRRSFASSRRAHGGLVGDVADHRQRPPAGRTDLFGDGLDVAPAGRLLVVRIAVWRAPRRRSSLRHSPPRAKCRASSRPMLRIRPAPVIATTLSCNPVSTAAMLCFFPRVFRATARPSAEPEALADLPALLALPRSSLRRARASSALSTPAPAARRGSGGWPLCRLRSS